MFGRLARLILAPKPKRANLPPGRAPAHEGLFSAVHVPEARAARNGPRGPARD